MGEWEKGEQYLWESLSISQKLEDFKNIAYIHSVLGWFYSEKGEYVKAREFFQKAYDVCEKAGVKRMGELFHKMGAKKDIEKIIAKKNLLTA
jgi:tetratricopeptide (TPR) repeat protein